jgi:Tol biopolymer transport system component
MPSIIPGYQYDIFISYRQKDNKYDGWVTEFVDNLQKELEATFKEEISVYFDINPHDGLLETHEVGDSLKEKLKCLVFIPIISRTYCDPKSFAWEHEFKAFVKQASGDQFGLKVTLPNGNVASRVLPVRIYDLDNLDIKLCESVLSAVLRGVEFIYQEPGVNRPLRSNEENPHENLNNTIYRNQINKVANAIKDIVLSLKPGSVSAASDKSITRKKIPVVIPERKEKVDHKRPTRILTRKFRNIFPWFLTGVLAVVLVSVLVIWQKSKNEDKPVYSFIHQLPDNETIGNESAGSSVAISPDGTTLVYVSRKDDKTVLSQRPIGEIEAQQITGTEGAESPFFSPDSKWVAFFADGNLKKISLLGGAPQTICEAKTGSEGCWGKNNTIIYADFYKGSLMQVMTSGGTPIQLTTGLKLAVGEGEHSHVWPQILPGDKIILFTIWHNSEDMRIVAYSLETGERRTLIDPGSHAYYIKTGHIVYAWKGDLLAVPFNPEKIEVTGQQEVILKGVSMNNLGLAHFSISDNGSLIYVPGNFVDQKYILTLVDHKGNSKSLNIEGKQSPRFSFDGKKILNTRLTQGLTQLWIYDMERDIPRRFTEKEFETWWAIWTPDDRNIIFNSNMQGSAVTMYQQMADGTGPVEKIISGKYHQQPKCWANDGTTLIYTEGMNPETGMDIYSIQPGIDTIPKPLLNSRFNEVHPSLSPDGHWLAYVSDEFDREEVFVCSYPDLSNRIQISPDGGVEPLWSPDGKELYYRDITGAKLMSVKITYTNGLKPGIPELLFKGKYYGSSGLWGRNYDISPDGKMFLMLEEEETTSKTSNQINVILNWSETLKD